MGERKENRAYVSMMVDSLKKKKEILCRILSLTEEQQDLFSADELDVDLFDSILEQKGKLIDELNELDDGFDGLFQKVKPEVKKNALVYKDEIQAMQTLIGEVSELGVSIRAKESRNEERFKKFLSKERENIRSYHVNNKIATTYHQNMTNAHRTTQSYFFNEKK